MMVLRTTIASDGPGEVAPATNKAEAAATAAHSTTMFQRRYGDNINIGEYLRALYEMLANSLYSDDRLIVWLHA
jgi:hypothetical protein